MDPQTKNNVALAHPYHVVWTDGRENNVALASPYHEGKSVASLIKFRSVVYRISSVIRRGYLFQKQSHRSCKMDIDLWDCFDLGRNRIN